MRGLHGQLAVMLLAATSADIAEHTRLDWMWRFSPSRGYRNIRHRSQRKLRKLARQRGY